MKRITMTVTTAADGTVTADSPVRVSGEIHQMEYVKDTASAGANAYADGVDFTITGKKTGINLWTEANVNASAVRAPRQPTHSQAGVASLYAAGGTGVQARVALANDQIRIVLAQGGAAKVGTFHILVA